MNFKTKSKSWLSFSLILIIWLNGLIPFVSSAAFLSSMNNNDNIDAVLICTTSGYKWVSKSAMFETRKLVFLDRDIVNKKADLPSLDLEHNSCPIVVFSDQNSDVYTTSLLSSVFIETHTQLDIKYTSSSNNAHFYIIPPSRAPPLTH